MKGGEERRNREAASRYLITRTLCKIRRVSKINIRLELMFVSRSKHEEFEENSSANFVNILLREYLRNIWYSSSISERETEFEWCCADR